MPVLMPSPVFRWFTTAGLPAAGYKANFYAAGTATAKTIYTDAEGTAYPAPSNQAVLNAEGYAVIFLGTGTYKLIVTDPDDAEVFTQDDIQGSGSFSTGFCDTVIADDTSGLKDVDTNANRFTYCAGYQALGDGGHGMFWNEASSDPDDTGYVIASVFDPTKRWFRIPDESGDVRAASFGYIGSLDADLSDQLLAASAYASGYGFRLLIGTGATATIGTDGSDFQLYATGGLHLASGSMLTGDGTFTNLRITGIVTGTREQHFTSFQVIFNTTQASEYPEWFGASTGSLDNTAAFTKWFASQAASFTLPPGAWKYADTSAFPYPSVPFILLGSIDATTGSDIPTGVYFPDDSRFRLHQVAFPSGGTITDQEGTTIDVAANVNISLDLAVTGDISSEAGISAIDDATIRGNVYAGSGSTTGKFFGKAGITAQEFAPAGQLAAAFGDVTTSGTTETDLRFYVMPGNTLQSAGDRVLIRGGGTTATTDGGQNRGFRLLAGAVVLLDATFNNPGTWGGVGAAADRFSMWAVEAHIFMSAAGTISGYALVSTDFQNANATASNASVTYYFSSALTLSSDQTVQFKATASGSGSITQSFLTVEYFPAP